MKTALILDDDTQLLEEIKEAIESMGWNCFASSVPDEALNILKTHPSISSLIVDFKMHVMDGLTFFRLADRLFQSRRPIRKILMSAHLSQQAGTMAQHLYVDSFLLKPVTKEALASSLNYSSEYQKKAFPKLRAKTTRRAGRECKRSKSLAAQETISSHKRIFELYSKAVINLRIRRNYGFDDPDFLILLCLYAASFSGRVIFENEVIEFSSASTPTAVAHLKKLAGQGLIRRSIDPLDGRRLLPSITAEGIRRVQQHVHKIQGGNK
jgi:CheY-like chemotaxis protein